MKNPHAQALGSLGGKAGTGDAKRRSKKHYRIAQKKAVEARKRNRELTLKKDVAQAVE